MDWGATKAEIEAVADKIQYSPSKKVQGIAHRRSDGSIGAMVLYDHWTENAVQMHVYSEDPKMLFDKEYLHEVFWFPFIYGKRGLAFGVTPCNNAPSLAVSRYLGFKEVYRIKDGWAAGTDMAILELRREECRWIPKETIVDEQGRSGTA